MGTTKARTNAQETLKKCERLRENNPAVDRFSFDVDEDIVIDIAGALLGNSHVRTFEIKIPSWMSEAPVKALADAISQSNISNITIKCNNEVNDNLSKILIEALRSLELKELHLDFPMTDEVAALLDRAIYNTRLEEFSFIQGRHLKKEGAIHLSKIVRNSHSVGFTQVEDFDDATTSDDDTTTSDDDTTTSDSNRSDDDTATSGSNRSNNEDEDADAQSVTKGIAGAGDQEAVLSDQDDSDHDISQNQDFAGGSKAYAASVFAVADMTGFAVEEAALVKDPTTNMAADVVSHMADRTTFEAADVLTFEEDEELSAAGADQPEFEDVASAAVNSPVTTTDYKTVTEDASIAASNAGDDDDDDNDTTQVVQRMIYRHGIQGSDAVRSLRMDDISMTDVRGLAFLALPVLETLSLEDCGGFQRNVEPLSVALKQACRLISLQMLCCKIGDDEMKILSQGLVNNQSIKILDLSNNSISDVGIQSFVENWSADSLIEILNVSGNEIGLDGTLALLLASLSHETLKEIDLAKNSTIGSLGLQTLAEQVVRDLKLRKLKLNGCGMVYKVSTDDEIQAQQNASRAMLQAVKNNLKIQRLLFGTHQIAPEVEEQIRFVLLTNRTGRYLLSDHHGLGSSIWAHIFAKRESTASLIYFFLREQPPLVPCFSVRSQKRQRCL